MISKYSKASKAIWDARRNNPVKMKEIKSILSKSFKKTWKDPSYRTRACAKRKEVANRPGMKEEMSRRARLSFRSTKTFWFEASKDKKIRMRSSYELGFAKWCRENKIKFLYEPKYFRLSNGKTYTPDFYLPKTKLWVEIKEYLTDVGRRKLSGFIKEFSEEKIVLVDEICLQMMGVL